MLLSAVLLAAAVQAVPTPCRATVDQAVAVTPPAARPLRATKLGDLPPANHTLTVLRSVDGCPVSSTIRFNVDRPAGR